MLQLTLLHCTVTLLFMVAPWSDYADGYTGVYSCYTPLDIHNLKDPLITEHNSLRTQPLYIETKTRSGVICITIQVQCIFFIEGGIPSDYWRPEG